MRIVPALIVVSVLSGAALGAPRPPGAAAPPLPHWDAASCGALAVRAGETAGPPGALHLAPWTVSLTKPDGDAGGRLRAASLSTDGPPGLDALAPLFAGGMLVGMERHRPHDCDLAHSFREAAAELAVLKPGETARERWTGVRAAAEGSDASAATIRLEASHGADGTARLAAETTGFSAAGNDMTAEPLRRSRVVVAMPYAEARRLADGGALGPDDVVRIEDAVVETEDGRITATGTYVPALREGRLHVTATDFDDLKDALPVAERTEAGAAFLVLRMAAREEKDGAVGWDVVLDDTHMTINGIPLPLP